MLVVIIVKSTTVREQSVQMMMSGPTISTKIPLPAFQRLVSPRNVRSSLTFGAQMAMFYSSRQNGVGNESKWEIPVYDTYQVQREIPESEWPPKSMEEIMGIAFRGRFIDSLDHPAVRKLRGRA